MKLYQPKKRKKKLGRKIVALGILALLVFGLFKGCQFTVNSITGLGAFRITQISITAPDHIQKPQILALSGFEPGKGIYDVSLGEAKKRIRTHPWVKRVKIRRSLPSTIRIIVQSRQVKALTKVDNMIYYVDEDGKLIDKLIPGYEGNIPVINARPQDYKRLIELLDHIRATSDVNILSDSEISEVFLDGDNLIIYPSSRDLRIQLSIPMLDLGLSNLKKVWDDLEEKGETASMIDVTLPGNKVVVRGIRKIQ